MDFSKAINSKFENVINGIELQIESHLKDMDWRINNNCYNYTGVDNKGIHEMYAFTYHVDNAVLIFAELKKRFEAKGWRVIVVHNDSKHSEIQLYK